MVGSSQTIAQANFTLNTIVAETLGQFADRLEAADDLPKALATLIKETICDHRRIIFNGNNYTQEWVEEAARRGLPNIATTVEAIQAILQEKNLALLEKHAVLSRGEMASRAEILYENYIKTLHIEALTMIEMSRRQILPAVISYKGHLAGTIAQVSQAGCDVSVEQALCGEISSRLVSFSQNLARLEEAVEQAEAADSGAADKAAAYRDLVFSAMAPLRQDGDRLEELVDAAYWPVPTYSDMLFNV